MSYLSGFGQRDPTELIAPRMPAQLARNFPTISAPGSNSNSSLSLTLANNFLSFPPHPRRQGAGTWVLREGKLLTIPWLDGEYLFGSQASNTLSLRHTNAEALIYNTHKSSLGMDRAFDIEVYKTDRRSIVRKRTKLAQSRTVTRSSRRSKHPSN